MTEGTWQSTGYRPTASRALLAVFLLGLSGIVAAAGALASYLGHDIFDHAIDTATFDELDSWASLLDELGGLEIILLIVTAAAFLAWQYRTVSNVPWLGGGTPHWSPAWSVLWWFVPLASLFVPLSVMREVYRRLAWTPKVSTALVVIWWVTWMGSLILERITTVLPVDTLENVHGLLNFTAVAEVTTAIAAILAIVVVRRTESFAARRAAHANTIAQALVLPPLGFTTEPPQTGAAS